MAIRAVPLCFTCLHLSRLSRAGNGKASHTATASSATHDDCTFCCSRGSGQNANPAGRDDSEAETAEVATHMCTAV